MPEIMGFRGTGAFPLHGNQQDRSENLSRGSRPRRLAMPVIKVLLGLTIPTLAGTPSGVVPTLILLGTPYSMENGCLEV
ncbi:MAG: hypothetical protein ACXWLT_10770 [Rhizomicrobium sp.]